MSSNNNNNSSLEAMRLENIAVRIKATEYRKNPLEMAKHIRKFRHCFPSITDTQLNELETVGVSGK